MRYVFLSPHLDDAVLSAGGLIFDQARAGHSVEIWTFMCGYPDGIELTDFAKRLHTLWGTTTTEETIRIRRAEDQRAAARVGAKAVHFDFLDCIYRRGKDGQFLYPDSIFHFNPVEADLPAQIAQTIVAWLRPDDIVVVQLGVGGHVDHVIVRRAAEMLRCPLLYDADIPYLFRYPQEIGPKTAGMEDSVQRVSKAGLKIWQEAIEMYASQFSTLFDSPEIMRQKISAYWSERKGIRFWRPARTP
ncbi:MAG TPA: PIG-L family deacetylase [Anaerolineales bacterium]|nr:PIG-L family deacetylase [Anaerolineales bacterium]